VRSSVTAEDFERAGLAREDANSLAQRVREVLRQHPRRSDSAEQVRLWSDLQSLLVATPSVRWRFDVHRFLYRLAYESRKREDGPGPAWVPADESVQGTNLGRLMSERGIIRYQDFHRWSAEHRTDFWAIVLRKLGIIFRKEPDRILEEPADSTHPNWLPGAQLNIAESCFRTDPARTAILFASEVDRTLRRMTYGDLRRLAARVAHGLDEIGLPKDARVALDLPMTAESVGIYLGTILSGRTVVGIADASAAMDVEKRIRIGGAQAVFTIDAYVRDGKEHPIYEKVVASKAPRAVVLPREGGGRASALRDGDLAWEEFLPSADVYDAVARRPSDPTNVLFSSGTTKDPKAILWTHTTPIKSAADGYLHHDVRPDDVLAWPTSFGWMMGPWLTYASLVNGGAMALYVGGAQTRGYGEFIARTGVTMLGVVPKLVRGWKAEGTMEGLDWGRIRRFSSTGETSSPDEMLYLMALAGYKPILEYCGGTEVGGGYITGTMVQPAAPSAFSTAALGLDFVILDEGRPADRGEVFLVPPSIGLSNDLLNYDHAREYYAGVPSGPHGERLRRHGDQLERLGGGYYRHHGRIDDTVNIFGVKSSAEEIRSVLAHELVYDAKPVAVDLEDSGQHRLVIYAVPRDPAMVGNAEVRARLRKDFQRAIKERLNPLLAHVHDVVLVSELPQAGPGKTKTMAELRRDYLARLREA